VLYDVDVEDYDRGVAAEMRELVRLENVVDGWMGMRGDERGGSYPESTKVRVFL
jgi:hypothetical protein